MIASALLACALSAGQAAYVQDALDGWAAITRDHLKLPDEPLPWVILFDRTCAYHLAADPKRSPQAPAIEQPRLTFRGRPVTVQAEPITDAVTLPNGVRLPIAGIAFTSAFGDEGAEQPFFVTALPEVWAHDPKYAGDKEDWPTFVLDVLSHELVHTRQIVAIAARVAELHERYPILPEELNDDWLQKKFEKEPGIDSLVRAEVEMLHSAVTEREQDRARHLARMAIRLLRTRREAFYGPDLAAYSALEDLFLNMEGVACWAAFQRTASRRGGLREEALGAFRGNRKWWSQEEGLALFLALDRFVPDWRARVFPPELASPVDLLERAVSP